MFEGAMRVKKISIGIAVLVAVALASSCTELTPTGALPPAPSSDAGSSAAAAPDASAATEAPPTPTETHTPEEMAVINQYKGYSDAFYTVPDQSEATIRKAFASYTTAEGLDQVVWVLSQQMVIEGKRPAGMIVYGPILVTITGSEASIDECRDSSTETIISTVDGTVLSRGRPGTKMAAALTLSEDRRWLVTSIHGTVAGC